MKDEQCWVIKKEGYYVNPKYRSLYTGIATGFTFYSSEETMKKNLEALGEGFHSDYINLKDVPDGERIYD